MARAARQAARATRPTRGKSASVRSRNCGTPSRRAASSHSRAAGVVFAARDARARRPSGRPPGRRQPAAGCAGTRGCACRGTARCCSSARLAAIWSMIPQRAPTKSFSAVWPSCASRTSSSRRARTPGGWRATAPPRAPRSTTARAERHVRADAQVEARAGTKPAWRSGPGHPLHVVEPVAALAAPAPSV